jgi:hypothetical protein
MRGRRMWGLDSFWGNSVTAPPLQHLHPPYRTNKVTHESFMSAYFLLGCQLYPFPTLKSRRIRAIGNRTPHISAGAPSIKMWPTGKLLRISPQVSLGSGVQRTRSKHHLEHSRTCVLITSSCFQVLGTTGTTWRLADVVCGCHLFWYD